MGGFTQFLQPLTRHRRLLRCQALTTPFGNQGLLQTAKFFAGHFSKFAHVDFTQSFGERLAVVIREIRHLIFQRGLENLLPPFADEHPGLEAFFNALTAHLFRLQEFLRLLFVHDLHQAEKLGGGLVQTDVVKREAGSGLTDGGEEVFDVQSGDLSTCGDRGERTLDTVQAHAHLAEHETELRSEVFYRNAQCQRVSISEHRHFSIESHRVARLRELRTQLT